MLFSLAMAGVCAGECVKTVDLRSRVDTARNYFVVLCARDSEPWGPGHAFVIWVEQLPDGRVVNARGWGFYPPLEQGLLVVLLGDGVMADESTRAASVKPALLTHRLICCVDREVYYQSLQTQDHWRKAGHNYNLLTRNCTHFAHTIATSLGFTACRPKFCERPSDYLARLMEK